MSAVDPVAKDVTVEADRLGLSCIELAAMIGCSIPFTMGLLRGRAPKTMQMKRAIDAFLVRARRAKSRAEMTLPTNA